MTRSTYVPLGRLAEHKPAHPERTGYRSGPGFASDFEIKEWPSRGALLTTIRMQEKRAPSGMDWKLWTDSRMWKATQPECSVCRDRHGSEKIHPCE